MTILLIVFGFGLTIFIHELGHFIAARAVGVKVRTFCIGMGPRVIRLYRDKHGTDYIIALLPLGGYVEMVGQKDMPGLKRDKDGKALELGPYEEGHYLSKKPLRKVSDNCCGRSDEHGIGLCVDCDRIQSWGAVHGQ